VILICDSDISKQAVHEALLAAGFSLAFRIPCTEAEERVEWKRDPVRILMSTDLASGLTLFYVPPASGDDEAAGMLRQIAPCRSVDDLLREDLAARTPALQARAATRALQLGRFASLERSVPRGALGEGIAQWLRSENELVRTAAIRAAFTVEWPELDAAIAAVAERHAKVSWIGPLWQKARREREERERIAREKQERDALHASLVSLVEEQKWQEVLAASERAFEEKKPPVHAYRARALSLDGLGRTLEAFLWAGFWLGKSDKDAEAEKKLEDLASRLGNAPVDIDLGAVLLSAWDKLDDTSDALSALDSLVKHAGDHAVSDALTFFTAALRIKKSYSRQEQKAARAALEAVTARHPTLADGWLLLAQCHLAHDDIAGTEAMRRRALACLPAKAPLSAVEQSYEKFMRRIVEEAPTRASVWRSIASLYTSDNKFEDIYRVTREELAEEGKKDPQAFRDHAVAATFTNRHDEAIAGYRACFDAGHVDEDGGLRFNLACELARKGNKEEALTVLKEAIRRDKKWGKQARTDDYFASLWKDQDFREVVLGGEKKRQPEEVERLISRTLGLQTRGDGKAALKEGERAVDAAEQLEDPALIARALAQLGSVQTYHDKEERALRTLARAKEEAEEAFKDDPVQYARILHALGAGYHAAKRWDEARATYETVLALREKALGPDEFEVGIAIGDLARLAHDREEWEEGAALMRRSQEVLVRALAKAEGDLRLDIIHNLALLEGNRAWLARERELGPTAILEHGEAAASYMEQGQAAGCHPPLGAIQNLGHVLSSVLGEGTPPEVEARALALFDRLLVLKDPDPKVRAEKAYWNQLRVGIRQLKAEGATDQEIAEGIARAVRGHDPGEPVASHPAFANLSVELARRLTGSGDIVMVAMSLDLATSGAQPVEEAVGGLEAFALANLEGT
jgi:tetratricopeptide (TPR) repeat protein